MGRNFKITLRLTTLVRVLPHVWISSYESLSFVIESVNIMSF